MGNNQGIWKRYTDWTERSRNVISTPCHCMIADLRPKSAGQYHTTHSGSKQNKTSVLLARGHQTLFPLLRYGLIHERWNVRAFLELPTGGLEWEENSNQMVTEAHYYITTVQYYSTVRQNRPTLDFNFRPIKTYQWTVLIYLVPMTLLYLVLGGRGYAHPDKLCMGRATGACKMEKISCKMGFSSPRPLKFLVCAFLGHPRVV